MTPGPTTAVSAWIARWAHLLVPSASVLDVACGHGRHVRWLAERGCRVTGIDRDAAAVAPLRAVAEICVADIENGPWPLPGRRFDAVVVTNYLWRPLLPTLIDAVDRGGVLLYETFGAGNQTVGKPSNPQFLLQPAELLSVVAGLRLIAFEEGFVDRPDRFVQRVVAARQTAVGAALVEAPPRYRLEPSATGDATLK